MLRGKVNANTVIQLHALTNLVKTREFRIADFGFHFFESAGGCLWGFFEDWMSLSSRGRQIVRKNTKNLMLVVPLVPILQFTRIYIPG